MGTVELAAGKEFTVDFTGDQLISFAVGSGVSGAAIDPRTGRPLRNAVKNSVAIIVNGGKIIMTAQGASQVLDNMINMSGVTGTRFFIDNEYTHCSTCFI